MEMVVTLEPFSLTLLMELEDFESSKKMRFVIGLKKGTKNDFNSKVVSPIFHETQMFQMFD